MNGTQHPKEIAVAIAVALLLTISGCAASSGEGATPTDANASPEATEAEDAGGPPDCDAIAQVFEDYLQDPDDAFPPVAVLDPSTIPYLQGLYQPTLDKACFVAAPGSVRFHMVASDPDGSAYEELAAILTSAGFTLRDSDEVHEFYDEVTFNPVPIVQLHEDVTAETTGFVIPPVGVFEAIDGPALFGVFWVE